MQTHSSRGVRDRSDLHGEVGSHDVDVIREICKTSKRLRSNGTSDAKAGGELTLPNSADTCNLGLSSELAVCADLLRDSVSGGSTPSRSYQGREGGI